MNIWEKGIVLLILLAIGLLGCAPQAEFIKLRDDLDTVNRKQNQLQQRMEVVEGYLKDRTTTSQKGQQDLHRIIADLGVKIDQLSTDIQLIQGKLEENNHRISELAQRLDDQAYKIKELSAKVAAAEGKPSASEKAAAPPAPQEKGKTGQNPSDVYNRAYQDYVNGNYDLALTGFQAYLTEFPDATLASNAQYWIGECYYGKGEYKKAIEALDKVSVNYPKSEKIAASLLKAGFAYLELKDKAKAKTYLKKVVDQFPNTKEASLAKGKLGTIK
ncbi:MAG: tol-pal system protein YbgF [Nitrospirae bacterium]|nr:tol-pal system protein YbgF [Nitrospirota bacterium]